MCGFSVDPLGGADDDDLEELEASRLLSGETNMEDGMRRGRRGLMIPDSGTSEQGRRYGQMHGQGQSPASSYGATDRVGVASRD